MFRNITLAFDYILVKNWSWSELWEVGVFCVELTDSSHRMLNVTLLSSKHAGPLSKTKRQSTTHDCRELQRSSSSNISNTPHRALLNIQNVVHQKSLELNVCAAVVYRICAIRAHNRLVGWPVGWLDYAVVSVVAHAFFVRSTSYVMGLWDGRRRGRAGEHAHRYFVFVHVLVVLAAHSRRRFAWGCMCLLMLLML